MIQRIQSIYLLLVSALMAVTTVSPLALLQKSQDVFCFWASGLHYKQIIFPTLGIICFVVLSALTAFVSIFLFKKRKLQLKLGLLNMILILLFYITAGTYFFAFRQQHGDFVLGGLQYGIALPLIAFIINLLAQLRIKADEKLVRSLDRIR